MIPRIGSEILDTWHKSLVVVIIACRKEAKMTQEQLANRIGWHRTKIAKMESGERRIDVPEFILIASALNIDPVVMLGRVLHW